jgi:hypothetical protein
LALRYFAPAMLCSLALIREVVKEIGGRGEFTGKIDCR